MAVITRRKDFGADRIRREIKKMKKNPYIKVGYPKEFPEIKEDKEDNPGVTVLDVAIFHEFGTTKLPERSFIRATLYGRYKFYKKINKDLINQIIKGRRSVDQALNYLGLLMVKDIKDFIRKHKVKPPSQRVIEHDKKGKKAGKKGKGKTLWDTGQLINSLAYSISVNGKAATRGSM